MIDQGDCRQVLEKMQAGSVHCCVTSPPYWGLRKYAAHDDPDCIGLEQTLDDWIANIVDCMRSVRRVLRDDGSLWLNVGDSYAGSGPVSQEATDADIRHATVGALLNKSERRIGTVENIKPNNLIGQPWRLAFAMQADGWHLHNAIVWAKPGPMPESLPGWRWERCRVKVVEGGCGGHGNNRMLEHGTSAPDGALCSNAATAQYQPCPGCPKCEPNGGWVLKRHIGRCTKSYELVFLMSKTGRYFYDSTAVREENSPTSDTGGQYRNEWKYAEMKGVSANSGMRIGAPIPRNGRNKRDVWTISTQGLKSITLPDGTVMDHYAAFPEKLAEPCIMAGTSDRGVCPECGAPWVRMLDTQRAATRPGNNNKHDDTGMAYRDEGRHETDVRTVGWMPSCECVDVRYKAPEQIPIARPVVLDPYCGSGTVGVVCRKLGRKFVGIDISSEYCDMAKKRISECMDEKRPAVAEVPGQMELAI